MNRDTIVLLTLAVRLYRHLRQTGIYVEHKGLKSNVQKLMARMESLNRIAVDADQKGGQLETRLTDIATQIAAHVSDIDFATNVLGNSPLESEGSSVKEPPKEPPPEVGAATFPSH